MRKISKYIWEQIEKNKLWEGTQGCVPGDDKIFESEIKGTTAGKIVNHPSNAKRTLSERDALIDKLDRRLWKEL